MFFFILKNTFLEPPKNLLIFNEDSNHISFAEIKKFGEHLKNKAFNYIFTTYFIEKNNQLLFKQEIEAQMSSYNYHTLNLFVFLGRFRESSCSVLSFDEFKFCQATLSSIVKNENLNVVNDPLKSRILMEILFDYGKFFFNIYGYCIWQNR